jgi:hypothetical protein
MKRAAAVLTILAGLAAAPSARADSIDGDWCSSEGQSIAIAGPKIRIPSGTVIDGRYGRHAFAYEPPPGDPDEGFIVYLQLLDEETIMWRRLKDGEVSDIDIWHRCNVTSSLDCAGGIYSSGPLCHMTVGHQG